MVTPDETNKGIVQPDVLHHKIIAKILLYSVLIILM